MYYTNPLCTRLCFIRFMSTHPPFDKDKDKEEDDKDDLTMSKLDEFINNVRSSLSSSSLSLYLSGGGWVDMNLMKHNLVQRGLV